MNVVCPLISVKDCRCEWRGCWVQYDIIGSVAEDLCGEGKVLVGCEMGSVYYDYISYDTVCLNRS